MPEMGEFPGKGAPLRLSFLCLSMFRLLEAHLLETISHLNESYITFSIQIVSIEGVCKYPST